MPTANQNNNLLQALQSFAKLSKKERKLFLNVAGEEKAIEIDDNTIIDDVPTEEHYLQMLLKGHNIKAQRNIAKYKKPEKPKTLKEVR